MIYEQKSGKLFDDEAKFIAQGYAGRDEGKNNPEMENVKGIGPLPKGKYWKGVAVDSVITGKFSITLIPDEKNEMYGRSSFLIHGDSIKNPGTASHGCIVAPRKVREDWYYSDDKFINVI